MENKERIYKSEALSNGWSAIASAKTWWFDTSQAYQKRYTLDKRGIPIVWDEDTFETEETRQCTGKDTCTMILSQKDKKVLVIVHGNLNHVYVMGSVDAIIEWDDYNRWGLWAVKKHCLKYDLEAAVINPKIKTLEKFKVVKPIIKRVIELRDFMEGGGNEPAAKKDTKDKAGAKTG